MKKNCLEKILLHIVFFEILFIEAFLPNLLFCKQAGQNFQTNPQRNSNTESTSLKELIARLESDWQEAMTGKAYWIGYTSDMYSIASYNEAAIDPLIDFIKTTKSSHAKHGAILTLHLIGINRRIAGRMHEEFNNEKARKALLSLLTFEEHQVGILTLLMRDPWPSDIPQLFEILKTSTPHAWVIIKALQRYKIKNRPVHLELPNDLATIPCECSWSSEKSYHKSVISCLSQCAGNKLSVESHLLEKPLWVDITIGAGYMGAGLGHMLESFTGSDFCTLNSKIEYYLEDGKIHICSITTARKRWLQWLNKNLGKIETNYDR